MTNINDDKKGMWNGRFAESPDEFMQDFGASIDVDIKLLDVDILGSIAWTKALGKAGYLPENEVEEIVTGLREVGNTLKTQIIEGTFELDSSLEDVHMLVESCLTDLIGDVGAKLHTGRSRNDQVALDERMYLQIAIDRVIHLLRFVQATIILKAGDHVDDIVPSYTHLQQAQPVRLGHYLMSWFWMLERDIARFVDAAIRSDVLPLGSGAVAGSAFEVDRAFLASELGFHAVSENSIDATSDRDYILETLSAASILMMHLSRISEDMIIWSSVEFGFVNLSERYSTGSSMMPQKKNPDSLELIRGKTGRVYGNLVTLLTVMKGLPFSYGKDMQEDKEPLFDTISTISGCLRILNGVIEESEFNTDRMESSFDDAVFATDLADYLSRKGMPFRKAHDVAGRLVKWSGENNTPLSKIPMSVFKDHSKLFDDSVADLFDLRRSSDLRSLQGGTGLDALTAQINKAKDILSGRENQ